MLQAIYLRNIESSLGSLQREKMGNSNVAGSGQGRGFFKEIYKDEIE